MEWIPREDSVHFILNNILRSSANHDKNIQKWLPYLTILLTALAKLPPTGTVHVYRDVNGYVRKVYPQGSKVVWRGVSSCTANIGVLGNDTFLGTDGERIPFKTDCDSDRSV
jgi:hypothetical protein